MTTRRRVASKDVIPREQAARNEEDVAEAQVILNRGYGQVLGCPHCSTVYWLDAGEWREICTECGSAVVWDLRWSPSLVNGERRSGPGNSLPR